jgi:hypothetical protein
MAKNPRTKLNNIPDETIILYAQQDEQLLFDASNLRSALLDYMMNHANYKQAVAIKKLRNLMETFQWNITQYIDERDSRNLPSNQLSTKVSNAEVTHQLAKFKENLDSCLFRHNNMEAITSIVRLQEAINQTLPLLPKAPSSPTNDNSEMSR